MGLGTDRIQLGPESKGKKFREQRGPEGFAGCAASEQIAVVKNSGLVPQEMMHFFCLLDARRIRWVVHIPQIFRDISGALYTDCRLELEIILPEFCQAGKTIKGVFSQSNIF